MKPEELKIHFLAALYQAQFANREGGLDYEEWATSQRIEQELVDRAFDELDEVGLVEAYALGRIATITSRGVLFAEEHNLGDAKLIQRQRQLRSDFLLRLARIRDENGPLAMDDWSSVLAAAGGTEEEFDVNHQLLVDQGYIEFVSMRMLKITRSATQQCKTGSRKRISAIAFWGLGIQTNSALRRVGMSWKSLWRNSPDVKGGQRSVMYAVLVRRLM